MAERTIKERNAPPGVYGGRSRSGAPERIALLRNRVARARTVRDKWKREYKVDELYDRFYGTVEAAIFADEDSSSSFSVNKILPTVKTIIPSLFLQNPFFQVRSKVENTDPSTVLKAKMGEAALKAIADQEYHLEFSIKLAVLQSFFAIGVLKCVYEPKMVPNPRKGELMMHRSQAGIPILDENKQPMFLEDENGAPIEEPDEIVDDESYRWDWVNGDKMLLPDAGPNHLRWPWIAEEVTVLLEDARHDERFPANLRSQLKSNTAGPEEEAGAGFDDELGQKDSYLTYVEFWDIRKRKHCIYAEGQTFDRTQFLLEEDTPAGVESHPYALLLGYTPIIAPKSCPWPLPHIYSWLPLQREHDIRRRQLVTGAKRTARKIFYTDGTFEDADQATKALQSSEDMEAVKITSLDQAPVVVADKELPISIAQDLALLEADWAYETGVSGARSGGRNKGADSVYEAKVQVQSGEIRDLDMRHAVNIWLTVAGRKMLRLLKATMTLGMYVRLRGASDSHYLNYVARVYGPEIAGNIQEYPNLRQAFDQQFGEDKWIELTGEDLDFEAEVSVAPGSARPRNMENEKQDFFQILQVLGSVPILTQSRALLNRTADMFEFFDISMIDEILAASQKANEIEQMKAGRMQGGGGGQMPAAMGNGANMSSFRREFAGA